ncbi:MAG: RimK family alpha-L-glutamate ligase [Saprospiraceae bacterium]|jgi:ribosomal protein S6--L-glutamate ligase
MNIAIFSRGPLLYSTQSLFRAGEVRGHNMQIIDLARCSLFMENGRLEVVYDGASLSGLDAVIPRIGTSVTQEGISLIGHLEMMGVFTTTRSQGLWQARDKLRALQRMQGHGIPSPKTAYPLEGGTVIPEVIERLGGFPVIIKMTESTHGIGVMLAETARSAKSTLDAFHKLNARVIVQEYIRESHGTDIRVLVVNGRAVAAMQRIAQEGEFRSNLHCGGHAVPAYLSPLEQSVAVKAARIMGLDVAGIDLLRSSRGPLVIEANASPGLEGIETTTGVDVAGKIIQFIERKVSARPRARIPEQ